jgi:hypothetical protein
VAEFDHWCRAVMNEAMEDLVQALNPGQPDALEISGTRPPDFDPVRQLSGPNSTCAVPSILEIST